MASFPPSDAFAADALPDANMPAPKAAPDPDAKFDCMICFETLPRVAQRCSHNFCKACFTRYITERITEHCEPFPRCAIPECYAPASEALIGAHITPTLLSRVRYLRSLRPARATDGRRMWCVREGCYEQLAPPVPPDPAVDPAPERTPLTSILEFSADVVTAPLPSAVRVDEVGTSGTPRTPVIRGTQPSATGQDASPTPPVRSRSPIQLLPELQAPATPLPTPPTPVQLAPAPNLGVPPDPRVTNANGPDLEFLRSVNPVLLNRLLSYPISPERRRARSVRIIRPARPPSPPRPPPPPLVSACGACGTRACMRCAAPAHEGACVAPTTNMRQDAQYARYAVDRIAACDSCGAHVERNGGCNMITCSQCGIAFRFNPFASVRQVHESLAFINPHAVQDLARLRRPAPINRNFVLGRRVRRRTPPRYTPAANTIITPPEQSTGADANAISPLNIPPSISSAKRACTIARGIDDFAPRRRILVRAAATPPAANGAPVAQDPPSPPRPQQPDTLSNIMRMAPAAQLRRERLLSMLPNRDIRRANTARASPKSRARNELGE